MNPMSSLKRKRTPEITFRKDIEVHTQYKDGTWAFMRRSLNDLPFAAVYNAINKTVRISVHYLTIDRIYHIIEALKPSEMTEHTFLHMLLLNLKKKYVSIVQKGWTILGDARYTSTALVGRIIHTIEQTIEDLEMLHEMYNFIDKLKEKEIMARKPFKLKRKNEMNIPPLIL